MKKVSSDFFATISLFTHHVILHLIKNIRSVIPRSHLNAIIIFGCNIFRYIEKMIYISNIIFFDKAKISFNK